MDIQMALGEIYTLFLVVYLIREIFSSVGDWVYNYAGGIDLR